MQPDRGSLATAVVYDEHEAHRREEEAMAEQLLSDALCEPTSLLSLR